MTTHLSIREFIFAQWLLIGLGRGWVSLSGGTSRLHLNLGTLLLPLGCVTVLTLGLREATTGYTPPWSPRSHFT